MESTFDYFYTPALHTEIQEMPDQLLEFVRAQGYGESTHGRLKRYAMEDYETGQTIWWARKLTQDDPGESDDEELLEVGDDSDEPRELMDWADLEDAEEDSDASEDSQDSAWSNVTQEENCLLQRHLCMRLTKSQDGKLRNATVATYVEEATTYEEIQSTALSIHNNVQAGRYICDIPLIMSQLQEVYKTAKFAKAQDYPDIYEACMDVITLLAYAGPLRTACRYLSQQEVLRKFTAPRISTSGKHLSSELQAAIEMSLADIKLFSHESFTKTDHELSTSPYAGEALRLERKLWLYLLDEQSRSPTQAERLQVDMQRLLDTSANTSVKIFCLGLAITVFPEVSFDIHDSSILFLAEQRKQWHRDQVFGTQPQPCLQQDGEDSYLMQGLSTKTHSFSNDASARLAFYGSRRKVQLPPGVQDDLHLLTRDEMYMVDPLFSAMCKVPEIPYGSLQYNPLDSEEEKQEWVQRCYIEDFNKEIKGCGESQSAQKKFSALAYLLAKQVVRLHTEGDELVFPESDGCKADLSYTATERFKRLLLHLTNMKGLVTKCVKDGDLGIAEIIAFPDTFYHRFFKNKIRNAEKGITNRALKASQGSSRN